MKRFKFKKKEPIVKPIEIKKEEPMVEKFVDDTVTMTGEEPKFLTTDEALVAKLQNKFDIESVNFDPATKKRTFTFYVKKSIIERYLNDTP